MSPRLRGASGSEKRISLSQVQCCRCCQPSLIVPSDPRLDTPILSPIESLEVGDSIGDAAKNALVNREGQLRCGLRVLTFFLLFWVCDLGFVSVTALVGS